MQNSQDAKCDACNRFVEWAPEAKLAQVMGESPICVSLMQREKTEPTGQSDENRNLKLQLRVQKVGFLIQDGVG